LIKIHYLKNTKYDNWKIITTTAVHCSNSGFGNIFIGKPDEVYTGSYISFDVNNKNEAKSLLSYMMNCKLSNFMLSLRKITHAMSANTCKWIPLIPLDKLWTNDDVYKYFKLTKDEIKLIEDTHIHGFK